MSEYHLWSLAIYWLHCSYTIYSLFCWTSKHKLSDTHIYFNWSHWNWAKIIAIKIHAYAHCTVFIYDCRADIFFSTGFLHFLSKICGFIWSSHLFTINNQSRCLWMFCLFVIIIHGFRLICAFAWNIQHFSVSTTLIFSKKF